MKAELKSKEVIEQEIRDTPTHVLRPVSVLDLSLGTWVEDPHNFAVTESDSFEVFTYVSTRYTMVQFEEYWMKVSNTFDSYDGFITYNKGKGALNIFPHGDEFAIPGTDGVDRIGITAYNSVDKTSALTIRFVVSRNNKVFLIPKKVAKYSKPHVGDVKLKMDDFIKFTADIKGVWGSIYQRFSEIRLDHDSLKGYCKAFKIGERIADKLATSGEEYNLWSLCLAIYDEIDAKKYTSEVHKRERLDEFTEAMFTTRMVLDIE